MRYTDAENRLVETMREFRPAMVNFCSRLLQIPSVNGVDDEIGVAEAIAAQAQSLGLHVQIVGDDPRRPNVIVSTSESGDTGLLLIGHMDTVPPGDEAAWTYPPYSGKVADGRIFGRGTIDTKGGITSALYTLAALSRTPDALATGRAQLICVPDEESGATGTLGIKYLHQNGLLSGLGAIYAYSGDQIVLGHRGLVRYRIVCKGEAIHTGALEWQNKSVGANAVTGMARLLVELENIETQFSTTTYFEPYRTLFTPGTVIQGGVSINIVPDRCEALVDIRITPEFDLARTERLLDDSIRRVDGDRLTFRYDLLNYVPAAISDERAPIFSILEAVIQEVKSIVPERVVAGPANEGYLLIERGIPTVCGLGPAGANAHAVNEYVEIQGLVDAAIIFALTASRLSTYPPSGKG
jgi:acetylornithine deacetylase/succinyl-diaminopimelate desuccinylase-like protein